MKKNNGPNFSRFLLVAQFMMQIKFNFNNFIFMACVCHSLASCQRHTPSSLAAVIGLSNNDVISLRSLSRSQTIDNIYLYFTRR